MKYKTTELISFAIDLLQSAGLPADKAKSVAEVLVEGDLLGHTTHGLALLAPYLAELEKGSMRKEGNPSVVSDFPAALTWDGNRLPGPWLVLQAMQVGIDRAKVQGTCTVVIRRSHHIACLAAYHQRATDHGAQHGRGLVDVVHGLHHAQHAGHDTQGGKGAATRAASLSGDGG